MQKNRLFFVLSEDISSLQMRDIMQFVYRYVSENFNAETFLICNEQKYLLGQHASLIQFCDKVYKRCSVLIYMYIWR